MDDSQNLPAVAKTRVLPWDEGESFARLNPETDLVEIIHLETGKLVALVGDPTDLGRANPVQFQELRNSDGDTVFVQVGVPLEFMPDTRTKFTYSKTLADLICEKIATGSLITKVSQLPGMPSYTTIKAWSRAHPEFDDALKQAYIDRADYFADLAVETALELRVHHQYEKDASTGLSQITNFKSDADSTGAARAKIDAFHKAAAFGNQDRYGSKTKVSTEHSGKIAFVVETGIRREGDPNFYVDETKKIRESIVQTTVVPEGTDGD